MSNIVVVETSNEDNVVSVEIDNEPNTIATQETIVTIEVVNTEKMMVSELPDNIPLTKIKKTGVDGLDYYLDNYDYKIDCGTP